MSAGLLFVQLVLVDESVQAERMFKISLISFLILASTAFFFITSTPIFYSIFKNVHSVDFSNAEPLNKKHINFAGEWFGEKGSWIIIHLNGTAEFRNTESNLRIGKILIQDDHMTIGNSGLRKIWKIQSVPFLENGYWQMRLENETYYRESDEIMVRIISPNGSV
ncbi:MAG: hypothetical protein AB7V04_06210 [Desulfomonilaceae bacterium]